MHAVANLTLAGPVVSSGDMSAALAEVTGRIRTAKLQGTPVLAYEWESELDHIWFGGTLSGYLRCSKHQRAHMGSERLHISTKLRQLMAVIGIQVPDEGPTFAELAVLVETHASKGQHCLTFCRCSQAGCFFCASPSVRAAAGLQAASTYMQPVPSRSWACP